MKTLATDFSPLFLLHCYNQVASFLGIYSELCVEFISLTCPPSIVTENLHVKIVVFKLQNLNLRVTRRVVLLVHCIVPNVPISPQNPRVI